jgi:hypothetical protein
MSPNLSSNQRVPVKSHSHSSIRPGWQVLAACLLLLLGAIHASAQSAGTALRFDGANGFVQGPTDAALNPYPFTVTAWFRTTNNTTFQGIASKYADNSGNGWALAVQGGRLRGFLYRGGGFGNFAIDAVSTATVADGAWHHAAMVVDINGGRLILDGVQVAASVWAGNPGAPVTVQPLQIGRYFNYPPRFQGDIEEVTIWNQGLGLATINYIKHRSLRGDEDGLVALWRFDEGAGDSATDSTANARVATLVDAPEWINSYAPIALSPVAGTAFVGNGVDAQVVVPHVAEQNAFPITIMAWVKTRQNVGQWPGIVAKYRANTLRGYALALDNGRLYPWYYPDGDNFVNAAGFTGPNDRFIADGQWHHVAFVVDGLSGRTFIDGVQVHTQPWNGSPGPTTTTEDLLFGLYAGSPVLFNGQIDDVSIWNAALTGTQINQYFNLPRTGAEPGLVSAYNFDEPGGDFTVDLLGLADGTAPLGLVRTGSLARLGDGSQHLVGAVDFAEFSRRHAVQNSSLRAFPLTARGTLRRFHDYGPAPAAVDVAVTLDATLHDAVGTPMSLTELATSSSQRTLASYNASAPPNPAGIATVAASFNIEPVAILDSVNTTYAPTVSITFQEAGSPTPRDAVMDFALAPLLHFNGTLYFGDIPTTFNGLANTPLPGVSSAPDFLQTQLQLPAGGGSVLFRPEITFGGGAAFNIALAPDGTATNLNGTFLFSITTPLTTAGIRFFAFGNLTTAGATASTLFAMLPTGLGAQTSPEIRAQYPYVIARDVALNILFEPALDPVVFSPTVFNAAATTFYFAEETKPVLFSAPEIQWNVAAGEFFLPEATSAEFVRELEDDWLERDRTFLQNPLAGERVSNDSFYRHLAAVPGQPVYIRPDPVNGSARLEMQVDLVGVDFRPHLPYTGMEHSGPIPSAGGRLYILDDLIDVGSSYLSLGGDVQVPYRRDCPDTNCSGVTLPPMVLPFTPAVAGQLNFTPDGGLIALGSVPAQNLTWGYTGTPDQFTQRTSDISDGAYHMPGTFLRGDQTSLDNSVRPAVLLFTGYNDPGDAAPERPGMTSYEAGFANYGGLNFRSPIEGRSTLAERDTGWYPLVPQAKYYARYGGVSGIHQAASFPSSFPLSGYDMTFSRFALSYLDSDNWESRTDGRITFPEQPAGFFVDFERMKFLCRGALADAQLPANTPEKHLNYWNTDLLPLSMEFRPTETDLCSVSNRFLVLGVETKLPFIPEKLHASLGFRKNGNIAVAADKIQGITSRFPLPGQLSLQGSGDSHFAINTSGDGYFNNWETAGRPAEGFYNIAGRIDLPFFEDSKIHLHVTPITTNTAKIDIMGGWRAADQGGPQFGWRDGTDDFFTKAVFDAAHRGFPERSVDGSRAISIAEYRNSPVLDFHPRAQRNWIEVAIFDYPLVWNPTLRQFASFEDSTVILPIINVDSRLKELTPGKVDLDFAQDLELKLPRIKLLDLANDAFNEINGPFNSMSNALRQAVGGAVDATGLTKGFRSMQRTLRDEMTGFFRPVLEPALEPVVNALYTELAGNLTAATDIDAFRRTVLGAVNSPAVGLQNAVRNINGVAGQASSVAGQLNQTLTDIDNTLGLFLRILQKDGSGNRNVVRVILQKIAEDQGALSGIAGAIADPIANEALREVEPTLAKVEERVNEMRREFNTLRGQLGSPAGDFSKALGTVTGNANQLAEFSKLTGISVSNYLASVVMPSRDYFTANPAAAKQALRDRLITGFLGSPLPAKYQQTFKQFLYEGDAIVNQLTETIFQQINQSIRNALSEQFAGARDGIFAAMKGPGLMSGSLASAQIRGAPTFNGDAMKKIRLDAKVKLKLPDDIEFNSYMEIRELDSQSVPKDCIPAGAPAAEIIIGAADVPLNWPGVPATTPLTLTIEARWTQQSGNVLGVGGLILIKGEIGFKGCSVKEIGATMAFGELETYFAAKAAGTILIVGIPVNVSAGLFVGKACRLDPLLFIDPEAGKVLGDPLGFRGVYVQFGGGLSLSEILFGVSNCFLDAEATVTTATYYSDGPASGKFGMRQKLALDLSLICLISGHADLALFASAEVGSAGYEFVIGGEANLCGSLGPCPFCISGCVGVTVKGTVSNGGIDYSID